MNGRACKQFFSRFFQLFGQLSKILWFGKDIKSPFSLRFKQGKKPYERRGIKILDELKRLIGFKLQVDFRGFFAYRYL